MSDEMPLSDSYNNRRTLSVSAGNRKIADRMSLVYNREKPRPEQIINKGETFGVSNWVSKCTVHDQESDLSVKAHVPFSIQFMLIQEVCIDRRISSCITPGLNEYEREAVNCLISSVSMFDSHVWMRSEGRICIQIGRRENIRFRSACLMHQQIIDAT
jgi:hypothetical protein